MREMQHKYTSADENTLTGGLGGLGGLGYGFHETLHTEPPNRSNKQQASC